MADRRNYYEIKKKLSSFGAIGQKRKCDAPLSSTGITGVVTTQNVTPSAAIDPSSSRLPGERLTSDLSDSSDSNNLVEFSSQHSSVNESESTSIIPDIISTAANASFLQNIESDVCINANDCVHSDLAIELKTWYNTNGVNLSSFKNLLHILHKYHSELPLDPRTLLKNDILVESLEIENFDEGQFVYFGIGNSIKKCYDFFDLLTHNTILLDINIDGVPVYRSG